MSYVKLSEEMIEWAIKQGFWLDIPAHYKSPDFTILVWTTVGDDQVERAWMPGFDSLTQVWDHLQSRGFQAVYPKQTYGYDIRVGEVFGPLRREHDRLLWWQPLEPSTFHGPL